MRTKRRRAPTKTAGEDADTNIAIRALHPGIVHIIAAGIKKRITHAGAARVLRRPSHRPMADPSVAGIGEKHLQTPWDPARKTRRLAPSLSVMSRARAPGVVLQRLLLGEELVHLRVRLRRRVRRAPADRRAPRAHDASDGRASRSDTEKRLYSMLTRRHVAKRGGWVSGDGVSEHPACSSAFFFAAICEALNCFSLTEARVAAASAFASADFSAACSAAGLGAIVLLPCATAMCSLGSAMNEMHRTMRERGRHSIWRFGKEFFGFFANRRNTQEEVTTSFLGSGHPSHRQHCPPRHEELHGPGARHRDIFERVLYLCSPASSEA